jgi:hypothetical protein
MRKQGIQLLGCLWLEPVHGVFNHAMDTFEIAPEFHGHGDVLRMVKTAHEMPLYA